MRGLVRDRLKLKMSSTEALRIQREENTEEAALIEAVRRQDQLKEENLQLKAVYDQLLLDSQADQQALEELQANLGRSWRQLGKWQNSVVRYRELERQRKIVKSGPLLQQIAELQKCVEMAGRREPLSYSSMEEVESVSGGDAGGDARLGVTSSDARLGVTSSATLRVTPSGPLVVSNYVQLVSLITWYREPTPMHGVTSAGEKGNLFGSGSAWRVLGDSGGSCTVSAGGSTCRRYWCALHWD